MILTRYLVHILMYNTGMVQICKPVVAKCQFDSEFSWLNRKAGQFRTRAHDSKQNKDYTCTELNLIYNLQIKLVETLPG